MIGQRLNVISSTINITFALILAESSLITSTTAFDSIVS